jgi:hypothetical protein
MCLDECLAEYYREYAVMPNVPYPPIDADIVDVEQLRRVLAGRSDRRTRLTFTRPWQQWFTLFFQQSGGLQSASVQDIELLARVAGRPEAADLRAAFATLEQALATHRHGEPWHERVAALETQVLLRNRVPEWPDDPSPEALVALLSRTLALTTQLRQQVAELEAGVWLTMQRALPPQAVQAFQGLLALDAAQVTSGTFADARIAESNVTQHEGAIQLSALDGYFVNLTTTVTAAGFSGTVDGTLRYHVLGDLVLIQIPALSGTSNATTFTFDLPVGLTPIRTFREMVRVQDAGVQAYGHLLFTALSATVQVFYTVGEGATWTASGTKGLSSRHVFYSLV